MPDSIGYDRGVHLRGTPLWFDCHRRKEYSVLTSLIGKLPPNHARVLAPMALANTLEVLGYGKSVLPAHWNKWIVFGGQKVKFIDFGGLFGTGGALIAGAERVLVAGLLPLETNIQWQSADHLVAVLPALSHRGAPVEQVVGNLVQFVEQASQDGVSAGIYVDSFDIGYFLVQALRTAGVAMRPLGLLAKALQDKESPRQGVRIALVGSALRADRRCWVDSGIRGSVRNYLGKSPDATFRLKWYADLPAVKQVLRRTGVSQLSLIGADSRKAADLSGQFGAKIEVRGLTSSRQLEFVS